MNNSTASLDAHPEVLRSLTKLDQICTALIAILDRSPEQVATHTIGMAQKFQSADLEVDKIIRAFNLMGIHLDTILRALKNHNLYDNAYRPTYGQTSTLVEALQEKWDLLCQKRRSSGFLNNTFGICFDDVGKKINKIYEKIPLYTQMVA